MSEVIITRHSKEIAVITLNRIEAANALSIALLNSLQQALKELNEDQSLRAAIITGAGQKVFCAGADLKERAEMSEDEARQTVELIGTTIQAVADLRIPTIAAINGGAFGGGLELALACDIRIAGSNARFGLTETSLGIIPGAGGTQRLPRIIGVAAAKELIFTARRIAADTAKALQIVSHVFPQENLLKEALNLAEEIARNAPLALKAAKAAINQGIEETIEAGLLTEKKCYETILHSHDRLEGLLAFKEKRKPNYAGH